MKKFKWYIPVIVLIALWLYHFHAANRTERNIDKAIREQIKTANLPLTVNYNSIKVYPFSGDIEFTELNVIHDTSIYRTSRARLDLRYMDGLNIELGGLEYGLKQIRNTSLLLDDFSYVNRSNFLEIKMDSLRVSYTGSLLEGLQLILFSRPSQTRHLTRLEANNFRLSHPSSGIGSWSARSVDAGGSVQKIAVLPDAEAANEIKLYDLHWTPPLSFQEQYGFFLKGFEYEPDRVPFDSLSFNLYSDVKYRERQQVDLVLYGELFDARAAGAVRLNEEDPADSELIDTRLWLENPSARFSNFLDSAERLFGFRLPKDNETAVLQLHGRLGDIRIGLSDGSGRSR